MSQSSYDIPDLDSAGLRKFGLMMGGVIALLFGIFFPWLIGIAMPVWPWIVAAIFLIWSLLLPSSLKQVYRLWMRFGLLLHKITTPLILSLVFYLVLFPIATIMRLVKGDMLAQHKTNNTETYRVRSTARSAESMEKPF